MRNFNLRTVGLSIFILTIILLAATQTQTYANSSNDVVKFNNNRLESVVRGELSKPYGDITKGDMEELEFLIDQVFWINEINDLTGLEYAVNLKHIELNFNPITDISPLKNATELEYLDLAFCNITDISVLKDLTNLSTVYLHNNNITDISSLENLRNLETLDCQH